MRLFCYYYDNWSMYVILIMDALRNIIHLYHLPDCLSWAIMVTNMTKLSIIIMMISWK